MKKMKKLLLIPALILFLACDSDDDGFYNRVYLESQSQLVFIEESATYNVGDDLLVTANIPRLLNVVDQVENVDLQRTSNAPSFDFSFVLERKNGSEWEIVDVTDDVVFTAPSIAVGGYFVEATAVFNDTADAYQFNGGIELTQPGDYRLSFTYNNSLTDAVELFSNSPGNNIRISLTSPSNQLNAEGYYLFTVN